MATLTVLGQDLSAYVSDWGTIEDIKEVLLAKTQLFSGAHSIELSNMGGQFCPYKVGSLFYGKAYFQSEVTITEDGEIVFAGLLKAVQLDKSKRTATLLLENYLSIPTSRIVRRAATTRVNAISEALSILVEAGLSDRIDHQSFAAAAARSSGAVVDTDFSGDNTTTVLAAVQILAELAGVSVFVRNGIIQAREVDPYQGSSASLRFPIISSNTISLGGFEEAVDNIKNVVKVGYALTKSITLRDEASIKACRGQELDADLNYGSGVVSIPDLASAQYFGRIFLERTSELRRTLSIEGADELRHVRIGDRHPVTDAYYGLDNEPFEVIETHRAIQKRTINLVLASLR